MAAFNAKTLERLVLLLGDELLTLVAPFRAESARISHDLGEAVAADDRAALRMLAIV